ncbi:MAG: GNAT family N-acetyltransferase [Lachnospiraceae bacterium]|nr:GNAT family N-acetyltransferase [Lachnospiraceae bacterium]
MKYRYSKAVRDNDVLRQSFNELTRQTFYFDFSDWYRKGHWGDMYIPHVLLDGDKVISNVSVNRMQFDVQGTEKNYIQLGTVMTDSAYRGQGLNREIMEKILDEYEGRADGIYLFGNDDVLDYYPKFGFSPLKEYEYYMRFENLENISAYAAEKVDMKQDNQCEKLYDFIRKYPSDSKSLNQNDAMYMSRNIGLYQFWLDGEYGNQVYYLPETEGYIVAELKGNVLYIHQIFGKGQVDIARTARAFGEEVIEVVLGFSPVHRENFLVREHKEEDCTLFVLGEDLNCIERDKMMFPVLSHA